jgi:hypothetical protein
MGFLKDHLSGEDTPQARRPLCLRSGQAGTLPREAQQAITPGPHRGLPSRAGAADRAADAAQAPAVPAREPAFGDGMGACPSPCFSGVPGAAWVHQQVYLNPSPKELMLRSHV